MQQIQYDLGASPCVAAFKSLRAGKNFFMWLLLLAILIQAAAFALVHFVGVLDTPPAQPAAMATSQPATTQPAQNIDADAIEQASRWEFVLSWALPTTKFFALVLALLAVLTFMFAVKLAIVGRLGGIAGFMSALFWSMVLLAMVTPWQQVLGNESFATGALYNLGELNRWRQPVLAGTESVILFYARFIAYPVLAMVVWIVVMSKFSRGYRDSIMAPAPQVESRLSRPVTPAQDDEGDSSLPME